MSSIDRSSPLVSVKLQPGEILVGEGTSDWPPGPDGPMAHPPGVGDLPVESSAKRTAFLGEYRRLLREVKSHTDDPGYHLELARFYIKHQYFKKAHSCLQVAKALQPRRIETHYLLGWLYQRETNWEQARQTYRQILRYKPNEPMARFHLGETLLALDQRTEAYEHLLKATELEPNLAPAYWHLGRLALDRKDFSRAMSHFQALKNIDANNPDVYYELGNVFRAQGQTDRAVMAYEKAHEISPGHVSSRLALAEVYLLGDLPHKAVEVLEAILRRDSTVPEAYLQLSRAYHKIGKTPQSLATLLQFQKVFPNDSRGHAELARLYFVSGEQELAEEEFLRAIEISPADKSLYLALGTLYLNLKVPTKAVNLYRDLCSRFPDDPQIHRLLGDVYDRFDRFEEAVEAYTEAITGDPDSDEQYCKRAKLYVKLGKYNEALRDFERARAINPECQEAKLDTELIRSHKRYQEAFDLYSKGTEALRAGNWQQAMGFYRQVLKLVPNSIDWLEEYLQLTLFTGQFAEASATFEKLLALVSKKPDLYRRYANLQYKLQNYEQAKTLYEKCVHLARGDVEARIGIIRCLRHKLVDRSISPGKFDALVTAYESHLWSPKDRNLALLELACLHFTWGHLVHPGTQWRERALEYLDKMEPHETEELGRARVQAQCEIHILSGDENEAIASMERLHKAFPHEAIHAQALLSILIETGQHARAFKLSEEFKEKFSANGLLRALNLKLFQLVASTKENPKSLFRNKIRALQQYVASNPEDWTGFFDLGMGLVYLSRPNEWFEGGKKAQIALNKAKSLEPGSPWPWWGLVKAALHETTPQKIGVAEQNRLVSILRTAINLFPNEAELHLCLGRVLHGSTDPERFEEGTRALLTASIMGNGYPPAHFDLAVQHQTAQDYTRACHHYLAVVESVACGRYHREVLRRMRSLIP